MTVRLLDDEHGAVMVTFALVLPVLILFVSFVTDVGNWFEHRKHLQMQADAAALAGAGRVSALPCTDPPIREEASRYSGAGDPGPADHNFQVGGTPPENVHFLLNSETYYNQPNTSDPTADFTGSPCADRMVDVKLTETDLPWYWRLANVPFINAHARVSIFQLSQARGALPVGVPDVNPKRAKVEFIDESTGDVLATRELFRNGSGDGGYAIWDNSTAPVSVTVDRAKIGVRVVLSGNSSSLTCGDPLVECYDAGGPDGILHVRGWTPPGSVGSGEEPKVGDVTLFDGSCGDPYFSSVADSCTIGVRADVQFNGTPSDVGAKVVATVDGDDYDLTYDTASGLWQTNSVISLPELAGPLPIELKWEQTNGTVGADACTNTGANPCQGTFGTVHRTFRATGPRSGPIKLAQIFEGGNFDVNSFERCSGTNTTCTHDLVVKIGLIGTLQNASDVNDPVVDLRVVGGSQNQSLDCDPNTPNFKDELATGCEPLYKVNEGTACPSSVADLWASAQPWDCVATQTGTAVNQVPAGLNLRIHGSEKPTSCVGVNNWSSFPNLPQGDPRIVQLFLVPFGSFEGSGNATFPVTQFATFYVTGYAGKGGGFKNPCEGQGDDPAPDGYIVGHFIKYVQTLNEGGAGEDLCDFASFGSCVAVLTE